MKKQENNQEQQTTDLENQQVARRPRRAAPGAAASGAGSVGATTSATTDAATDTATTDGKPGKRIQQGLKTAGERVRRLFPAEDDHPEVRYYKITLWSILGVIVFAVLIGITVLIVAFRAPETMIIPDLRNMTLADAVETLQSRGLEVRVQQRFHSDPSLRGKVVEQSPEPGGVIRAERAISLIVSKGAVLNAVGDYKGRRVDEVREELRAAFASFDQLLRIEDSKISYIFDEAPAGTILGQAPAAGTDLSEPTVLELLVSRGPEVTRESLANYITQPYTQVILALAQKNQPFTFSLGERSNVVSPGVIMTQSPEPGTLVDTTTAVELTVQPPRSLARNQVFDIFERTLPSYGATVDILVEVQGQDSQREQLFRMKHPGGPFSFPYQTAVGNQIIVSIDGAEVFRQIVTAD